MNSCILLNFLWCDVHCGETHCLWFPPGFCEQPFPRTGWQRLHAALLLGLSAGCWGCGTWEQEVGCGHPQHCCVPDALGRKQPGMRGRVVVLRGQPLAEQVSDAHSFYALTCVQRSFYFLSRT